MLCAAIAWVVWHDQKPVRMAISNANVHRATVNTVRIVRDGHPEFALSRSAEQWRMTHPCDMDVNEARLDPLLNLASAPVHSYAASEVDLEAAGLLSPQASVFFNDTELAIGQPDLAGDRRYVQRNDRIEFAPEWVLSLITGGITAFADLSLFPSQLQSLTLTRADGNTRALNPAEWQELTATQIVTLPLPDTDTPSNSWTLTALLANGTRLLMTMLRYPSYVAFINDNKDCALLLTAASVPSF